MEWAKLNLTNGLWKGVLAAAREVSITHANVHHNINSSDCRAQLKVTKLTICRILCESLEVVGGTLEVVECFNQVTSESTTERVMPDEIAWIRGKQ